uniref:histone deacetylase n=1 Tax=Anthurium amnicola TaxID=1678845 RepID=A0A1D1Z292_9ARAE
MVMANGDGWASVSLAVAGSSHIVSEGSIADKDCTGNRRSAKDADEKPTCLDGDHESCSVALPQKVLAKQRGSTLLDLSNMEEQYDDEDDDDSDWEPVMHLMSEKWFCTNCTMPNFEGTSYCNMCGEYKESKILIHGCLASRLAEGDQTSSGSDLTGRCQGCHPEGTAIGFDERMLLHCEVEMKSHPHPERPDRLQAIAASLSTAGLFPGKCFRLPAREITVEELQMVHALDHIEAVESTKNMLLSYFTPDTYANEHSASAARLAAGLCSDLASAIISGHARNGFALVRPPGHHAGVKQAMGFCLHNNAAVAALAAQAAGAKKVLIVDWDVHHGNGTQEIFEGNRSVLYVSLHRHENGRFYPGTGAAEEVGIMDAEGYCVNIPWKTGGVGDNDYIFAFQQVLLPIAMEFAPDLTIISAGFDAARGDPLGCCDVTPDGYAQMTYMLNSVSQGKLLVVLEGGYNLRSISSSAIAVIKVLLGDKPTCEMNDIQPSRLGLQTVLEVLNIQLKFWPILKSNHDKLQLQWDLMSPPKKKKEMRRRRNLVGPLWWQWSSKRLVYIQLYGKMRRRNLCQSSSIKSLA